MHEYVYAMLQYLMLQATHKMEMHDNGIINIFVLLFIWALLFFCLGSFYLPLSVCIALFFSQCISFFATMKRNAEEQNEKRRENKIHKINYPL